MEWIIILGLSLFAISVIWNFSTNNKVDRVFSAFSLIVSAIIFVVLFASYGNRNTPTAEDVYQGKTTLEITYRDSIPVDSIVVWKPEFKK